MKTRSALWRRAMACVLLAGVGATALTALPAQAAPALQGVVTAVADGDTFTLQRPGRAPQVVRIADIDAPEICQPWGAEAKQALTDRVLRQTVRVQPRATDRWQRLVAQVFIADGLGERGGDTDVGNRLVRDGHAWSTQGRNGRGPLMAEQRMARALTRGLHADAQAVHPAEFRQRHGPCGEGQGRAPAAAASPPLPAPALRQPVAPREEAFRCDGRTQCAQMRSCAEARYFLQQCPGVQMDGDGDGVPCELQWCGR